MLRLVKVSGVWLTTSRQIALKIVATPLFVENWWRGGEDAPYDGHLFFFLCLAARACVQCTSTRNLEVTSATPKNKIPGTSSVAAYRFVPAERCLHTATFIHGPTKLLKAFASFALANSGGYHHFIRLFRDDIRTYIMRMTDLNLPKLVVVCLVYYPDEQTTGSWVRKQRSSVSCERMASVWMFSRCHLCTTCVTIVHGQCLLGGLCAWMYGLQQRPCQTAGA